MVRVRNTSLVFTELHQILNVSGLLLRLYKALHIHAVLYEARALRGFLSIVVIFLTKLFADGMVADRSLMKVRNLVHDVLVLESSLSY